MRREILFGKKRLFLDVPARRVVGVLAPREVREVSDVDVAVRRSLRQPYESSPLAALLAGKKTALVVTVDNTRPSPARLIHPVLDACEAAGVTVTVLIANGRHRRMTDLELRAHLGTRIVKSCRVLQHDALDARSMVRKGTTRRGTMIRVNREIFRHDVVIGSGVIEPSYVAGWSGGRKLLMPGLAHADDIDRNHYLVTHPERRIGRLNGNPASDDSADFARRLPLHFIVYAVVGPRDEFTRIVSGHPVKAHEHACGLCEHVYKVKVKRADIVISSVGGWPYDCDLVQGKKAIIPATDAVKRNGVIIACAECARGFGAADGFAQWLCNKTPAEVVRDVVDPKQFSLGAHGANVLAKPIVEKRAWVLLVTRRAFARQLRGAFVHAFTTIKLPWELANHRVGRNASVLFIEQARRLITCR